jgi:hypothetical protein
MTPNEAEDLRQQVAQLRTTVAILAVAMIDVHERMGFSVLSSDERKTLGDMIKVVLR